MLSYLSSSSSTLSHMAIMGWPPSHAYCQCKLDTTLIVFHSILCHHSMTLMSTWRTHSTPWLVILSTTLIHSPVHVYTTPIIWPQSSILLLVSSTSLITFVLRLQQNSQFINTFTSSQTISLVAPNHPIECLYPSSNLSFLFLMYRIEDCFL